MMTSVDSFEFILNEILKDLKNLNDSLALIGLLAVGKVTFSTAICISSWFKKYLLPRLISNQTWTKSLGNWAAINGCDSEISLQIVQELADRKFNLILVDSNGSNLDLLSKYLVEKFKIETICVNLDDLNQLEDANKSKDIGILINSRAIKPNLDDILLDCKNEKDDLILSNLQSTVRISRYLLASMIARNKGLIVNVTSAESQLPEPFNALDSSCDLFMEKFLNSLHSKYRHEKCVYFQSIRVSKLKRLALDLNDEILNSKLSNKEKNMKYWSCESKVVANFGWSNSSYLSVLNAFKNQLLQTVPGILISYYWSIRANRQNGYTNLSN